MEQKNLGVKFAFLGGGEKMGLKKKRNKKLRNSKNRDKKWEGNILFSRPNKEKLYRVHKKRKKCKGEKIFF